MGKWYVCSKCAEGCSYFVVELNNVERRTIQKFIDAQDTMYDEGYSGDFDILDAGPFAEKRQAVEYMVKECCGDYCYGRGCLDEEEIEKVIDRFTNGG